MLATVKTFWGNWATLHFDSLQLTYPDFSLMFLLSLYKKLQRLGLYLLIYLRLYTVKPHGPIFTSDWPYIYIPLPSHTPLLEWDINNPIHPAPLRSHMTVARQQSMFTWENNGRIDFCQKPAHISLNKSTFRLN